jgi:hypothetical protein
VILLRWKCVALTSGFCVVLTSGFRDVEPIQFCNCLQPYGEEVAKVLGEELVPDSVIRNAFSADVAALRL